MENLILFYLYIFVLLSDYLYYHLYILYFFYIIIKCNILAPGRISSVQSKYDVTVGCFRWLTDFTHCLLDS